MPADTQNQSAILKEDYKMDNKKSLQQAAKLKVLAKTLHEHGGDTFESKVAWVKKHLPEVSDAESFVAAALRSTGELKPHKKGK